MKISLKWLSEYVDIKEYLDKPETLAALLTNKGFEVESIDNKAKAFDNVVIGHILKRDQHPDADRLTVCQVSTGGGVVHQIVCGAKNHKADDRVVVALPGAVLPGDFQIKKSKIRGIESAGMLCSEVELAIATESDGIMILPVDAPIGESFAKFYGADDTVFELKVTPNRADGLSHIGLAREIAALLGKQVCQPLPQLSLSGNTQDLIKVELRETLDCPRYTGRVIKGVRVQPSPIWLKRRLEAVGLNSINNVVDVTNFVMMELGQPVHAFDTRFLKGSKIVVAKAQPAETFQSLDGTEIKLDGFELMIRDGERNIALAGVVGGKNSGVLDDTVDLFIECAYFSASAVRRASRRHGIQTDAAYRFSRGVDPDNTSRALDRTCELIVQVAGGQALDHAWDIYPNPIIRPAIEIQIDYVSQRLGYEVKTDNFIQWMNRIGCTTKEFENKIEVTPPSFRHDIEIKEDLIEEYGRLNGYDQIPERLPMTQVSPTNHAPQYLHSRMVGRRLQAEGFQQAMNFAFVSRQYENDVIGDRTKWKSVGLDIPAESIQLKNPLSEDLNVMRVSLLPGLLSNVSHNQRYGLESGRLFEVGFAFERTDTGYAEDWRLGLVMWGQAQDLWGAAQTTPLILDLKSAVENLLKGINGRNWSWETKESPECVHPGQSASLFYEGKMVGFIGTLHPALLDKLKLKAPVAVAEFDLAALTSGQPRVAKSKTPSKFPMVERDLAFVMPKDLAVADVMAAIKKSVGQQLVSSRVFDVYEGDKVAQGMRSVAFRMIYQDPSATLTDEQLMGLQTKIIDDVSKKFGIQVR